MLKVVAPMAGITDSKFLCDVIPLGFNVATLGGYSLDEKTLNASKAIVKRGRKEFIYPLSEIQKTIEREVNFIKKDYNVKVSANVRSTTPEPIINVGCIKNLDIVEINCHCRQNEITSIGCGQEMLKRDDLKDFINEVVDNTTSKVSVKIRADDDTLKTSLIIQDAGADFIHIDAMKPGYPDADWELLKNLTDNLDIPVIGNNSVNSNTNLQKMIDTGVCGFSIARAIISKKLDFSIDNF